MPDETRQFEWVVKAAKAALLVTLALVGLGVIGSIVFAIVQAIDAGSFWAAGPHIMVLAFLIGAVSTLRGLQVDSSAEQLGRLTTIAVVQSITLIVAADAVFTFVFVRLGI